MAYVTRHIESILKEYNSFFPVTAILGPRQCGKSTLIKEFFKESKTSLYLDLESESDRMMIQNPEQFFNYNKDKQICLDEIQRVPEIFSVLRSMVDNDRRAGRFTILGSASRDLIKQSSESLAGRIGYLELTPFIFPEISTIIDQNQYWIRGGFPDSLLPPSSLSLSWRNNFIRTFLERDIPQMGFSIPAESLGRLWKMIAHTHGQILNLSNLGKSMGVSHTTIRNYIDLLNQTFVIRELKPFEKNLKKRLVKSSKIYVRDTGILHSLLSIGGFNDLISHPVFGFSWEGLIIENVCNLLPEYEPSFYRTSQGAELDLIMQKGTHIIAFECKVGDSPKPTKGFWQAVKDVNPAITYIVSPHVDKYPVNNSTWVIGLNELCQELSRED